MHLLEEAVRWEPVSARLWGGRRLAAPRPVNNSLCEWGRPMSLPTRACSSRQTWARGLEHSRACFPDGHHALREQLARLHVSGERCLPPALLDSRVPLRLLKTLEGPVSEIKFDFSVPGSLKSFEFVFCVISTVTQNAACWRKALDLHFQVTTERCCCPQAGSLRPETRFGKHHSTVLSVSCHLEMSDSTEG